jgi:sugar lactone lactonase YvrE
MPPGTPTMMKMVNTVFGIFAIITAGLSVVLLPTPSFGAENIKVRHITSIYFDEQGVGLKQPEGVICNNTSLLIVADTGNGRLLRYNFADQTLSSKTAVIKLPQLVYPVKAKLDSGGEIYVLDRKLRRIVRLTPEGVFKNYLDLKVKGSSSSERFVPRSFHIDRNDNIYVLDVFSGRIVVLSPEGKYRREIKVPQNKGFFSDLTVDFKGNILLIDSVKAVVFSAAKDSATFSPLTKSLQPYLRFPTDITTDKRGRIYLVDRNGSKVIILGQEGSYLGRLSGLGWKEGLLDYPSQICINNKGDIFIADTKNNRIQIFSMIE